MRKIAIVIIMTMFFCWTELPYSSLCKLSAQSVPGADLLLRDFTPRTRLEVRKTTIPRPKFPVIDVHFHMGPHAEPLDVLNTMNELNLQMVINLGWRQMWGDRLKEYVAKWVKPYPTRFAVMANINGELMTDPEVSRKVVAQLREDVANGAIGLKIFKDLGLVWRDADGELIRPDDPRLDLIWATCAELDIPVLIHVNDPRAFFDPVDQFNERYLSLAVEGRSSWQGKVNVTHDQLMQYLENVISRHPETTFVAAHMGLHYEHLYSGARWLDTYPNLYFELGASYKHLGRQPYTARRFLIKYQDRILFGCDIGRVPTLEVYRYMFRVLETDDEYFDHVEPGAGLPWKIYGLQLPDEVLEKIYRLNVIKVFPFLSGGADDS